MKLKLVVVGVLAAILGALAFAGPASASYPLQSRGQAFFGPSAINLGGLNYYLSQTFTTPSASANSYALTVAYLTEPNKPGPGSYHCTGSPQQPTVPVRIEILEPDGSWFPYPENPPVVSICDTSTKVTIAALGASRKFKFMLAQNDPNVYCNGNSPQPHYCRANMYW